MLCSRKRYLITRTLQVSLTLFPLLYANAQAGEPEHLISETSVHAFDADALDTAFEVSQGDRRRSVLESALNSVSNLDLQAPRMARREYDKGVLLLAQTNLNRAVERFKQAISIYPSYVAAHNALGAAYLNLDRKEEAQNEFSKSVSLDNHLPYSYLNLGWAQLAQKDFSSAQQSMKKATELAPVDLPLLTALTYAQVLNHDYLAAIATAGRVHSESKHEIAAVVHYFAAAAWQAQNNFLETRNELQTFLDESPQSPVADSARQIIDQIKTDQIKTQQSSPTSPAWKENPYNASPDLNGIPGDASPTAPKTVQQQLAEVESEPESLCKSCPLSTQPAPFATTRTEARAPYSTANRSAYEVHKTVNEVGVFFSATNHGRSVIDLTLQDVTIRDAGKPPETITSFRNELQLPLRLGLVIDTSNSITSQFMFEQKAAESFLRKCLVDNRDQAFLVGFNTTIVLVKDFTADSATISQGIGLLAPGGGTALWDAVKFASDKLGSVAEDQPMAKVVLVISDGEDNSSTAPLKEVIESAERQEVTIFTVSTRNLAWPNLPVQPVDRAMRDLAERTGGAAFFPSSIDALNHRLSDLQQVIHSRYLISYKPAEFHPDGAYRPITLLARKSGHKLRIYSRRGYYAPATPTETHAERIGSNSSAN
jgi:VWFA-related protein